MRVFCLALLCLVLALTPAAAAENRLPQAMHRIMAPAERAGASFGVAIYDVGTGRTIYAHNANRLFLAASTTKLLTEGTTLATLGGDYRFRTNVYRTGPVDADGTLHGDLVLVASGDPNLSGRIRPGGTLAFENEDHSYDGGPDTRAVSGDPLAVLDDFAAQIAARGIKRVSGRVIVDDSLFRANFPEPGTGAYVSPIVVNDNIVDVIVTPGAHAGDPVSISVSPQTPYAHFQNDAKTAARGTPRSIVLLDNDSDSAGQERVHITGTLPAGSQPILYAYDVPSPRRFAEIAFTQELQHAGVSVDQTAKDEAPDHARLKVSYEASNVVASHLSPQLSQDVKVTLKVSDNLHADVMPYLWTGGNLVTAFALEQRFLERAGLPTAQVVQSDGLGGEAFIAPAFMVRYLAFLRNQPYFDEIESALPVLGRDGTLFNIETHSPAAGRVHAKTGTWGASDRLNRRGIVSAKGLAGYMTARSGRRLAFCFYLNNLPVPRGPGGATIAGEILGRLATETYLYAR